MDPITYRAESENEYLTTNETQPKETVESNQGQIKI